MPHLFDFFLSKGWETTNPDSPHVSATPVNDELLAALGPVNTTGMVATGASFFEF